MVPYLVLMVYGTRLAPFTTAFPDVGPWLFGAAAVALLVVFIVPRVDWARTVGVVAGAVACFSRAFSAIALDPTPSPTAFVLWFVAALGLASCAVMSWQVIVLTDVERKAGDG